MFIFVKFKKIEFNYFYFFFTLNKWKQCFQNQNSILPSHYSMESKYLQFGGQSTQPLTSPVEYLNLVNEEEGWQQLHLDFKPIISKYQTIRFFHFAFQFDQK
jgi:hypothetical protein